MFPAVFKDSTVLGPPADLGSSLNCFAISVSMIGKVIKADAKGRVNGMAMGQTGFPARGVDAKAGFISKRRDC